MIHALFWLLLHKSYLQTSFKMNFSESRQTNIVIERLCEMQQAGHFCDVELMLQDRSYKAHRNVLAANSVYFNSIFNKENTMKEKINLVDCKNADALQTLLNFMYTGTMLINPENITGLVQLADRLKMEKVIRYCELYLLEHIDTSNCIFVRDLAVKYNLLELKRNTSYFIDHHIEEVLEHSEILKFNPKKLHSFFKNYSINSANLLKFICNWVVYAPLTREKYFSEFLTLVNWQAVTMEMLEKLTIELTTLRNSTKCFDSLLNYLRKHNVEFGENCKKIFGIDTETESSVSINMCEDDFNARSLILHPSKDNYIKHERKHKRSSYEKAVKLKTYPSTVRLTRSRSKLASHIVSVCDQSSSDSNNDHVPVQDFNSDADISMESVNGSISNNNTNTIIKKQSLSKCHSCEKCSFSTCTKEAYEQHLLLVHSTDKRYKCLHCDFTWTWHSDYITHLVIHFPGPNYNCRECEFSCDDLLNLSEHLFNHNKEEKFQCPKCTESFKSPNQVQSHWNKKHSNLTTKKPTLKRNKLLRKSPGFWKCEKCTYKTLVKERLQKHKFLNHMTDTKYKCPECNFHWSLKKEYIMHLKTHYKNSPYKCNRCNYVAGDIYRLLHHTFCHSEELQFVCEECVMGFKSLIHLQTHRNKYHRVTSSKEQKPDTQFNKIKKQGSFKCKNCSFHTTTEELLDHHVISVHQTKSTLKCQDCGFTSENTGELFVHLTEHYEGPPYKCRECSYISRSMKNLSNHLTKHSKEPQFKCVHCGQYYVTISKLKLHVDRVHPLVTPFACDECDRRFGTKNFLKEHKTQCHSKIQHLCDICGQCCKNKKYLWQHRLTHSEGRHFCDHPGCKYKTSFEYKLLRHKRIHTGERPFVCSFCGKSFISQGEMHKHEQIHLNVKFDCQKCHASFGVKHYLTRHIKRYHSEGAICRKPFKARKKQLLRVDDESGHKKETPGENFPQLTDVTSNQQDASSTYLQFHHNPVTLSSAQRAMTINYPLSINETPCNVSSTSFASVPAITHEIPTKFRTFMTFT